MLLHRIEFNNFLVQLCIQVSQDSVATDLRWGGRFNTTFLSSRSDNTTVKELLKSIYICQSYCKNKSGTLFWDTVYKWLLWCVSLIEVTLKLYRLLLAYFVIWSLSRLIAIDEVFHYHHHHYHHHHHRHHHHCRRRRRRLYKWLTNCDQYK